MTKIIKVKNLVKEFIDGDKKVQVLKGVNLEVDKGEFVAIIGRSGAGKSTCLYQLSLLDEPSNGEIILDGHDTHNMNESDRSKFRLNKLGYVFQDYSLIPELSALDNVAIVLIEQGKSFDRARQIAEKSLQKVGLGHRLDNLPSELSGGEQQRVAIARAISHGPAILFADEPTANLDVENSRIVIDAFKELNKEGLTVVMVTHEEEYLKDVDRVIKLRDGIVIGEDIVKH